MSLLRMLRRRRTVAPTGSGVPRMVITVALESPPRIVLDNGSGGSMTASEYARLNDWLLAVAALSDVAACVVGIERAFAAFDADRRAGNPPGRLYCGGGDVE